MLNRSILIGRLTKDPELRYSGNGTGICNFTLAVDNPYKNEEPKADFIPIVTFKQTAEAVANFLKKGRLCAVEGRIQTRNYENNEGRRIYVTEVVADNVRFLEKAPTSDAGASTNAAPNNQNRDPFPDDKPIDINDDDLPF